MATTSPQQLWQQVFRAFDPRRPLAADEIERFYVARPESAANLIAEELGLDPGAAPLFVVCGSRGSGKSTELGYLERRLRDDRVVLRLDLQDALPRPLSSLGLVLTLGVAGLRALTDWKAERQLLDGRRAALQRAADALTASKDDAKIDIAGLVAGVGDVVAATSVDPASRLLSGASAALARATQLTWSPRAGAATLEASDRQRLDVLTAVNGIFEELAKLAAKSPVVLADGLDKLTALGDVLQVLAEPRLIGALSVPVVLTGPINLLHNTEFNAVRQTATTVPLYNLVVREHGDDAREGPGGGVMLRAMAEKRVAGHGLPAEIATAEVWEALARASGGCVRDFVELVRSSARAAYRAQERAISGGHAEEAIRSLRHLLQFSLTELSIEQLQRVLRTGRPTGEPHCDELLFNNYILCYPNAQLWYRPHEVLIEWLEGLPEAAAAEGGG